MCRIIRVPAVLDTFFAPLRPHVHWHHWRYFRLLGLAMACLWGRRHVTNRSRDLEVAHPRTRFNNVFLVERWDPAAALRQQAHDLLRALRPRQGETLYGMLADSKHANRGKAMEAVATRQDPTPAAYRRGQQYVGAILVYRDHVLPFGIRLYVKKADGPSVRAPFHQTTALAAPLLRECTPPASVQGMVLCEAYDLGPTVVKACRAPHGPFASTLQRNRSLFKQGGKRHAGH